MRAARGKQTSKANAMRLNLPTMRPRAAGPVPAAAPERAGWFHREEAIMGTAIRCELWSDDATAAERALDAVMAEMHRIDRLMSPYKDDSELSLINRVF